jgi:hypothetical protein
MWSASTFAARKSLTACSASLLDLNTPVTIAMIVSSRNRLFESLLTPVGRSIKEGGQLTQIVEEIRKAMLESTH